MTVIRIETHINAPIERCFDVARSVDVHMLSTKGTNERAIAGRTKGLCRLNDEITWQATHFGIRQTLSSRITLFDRPNMFEDVMLKGAFKSLQHQHYFERKDEYVLMTDVFNYEVPYGIAGAVFNKLVLKKYLTQFLLKRNAVIKDYAEGDKPL